MLETSIIPAIIPQSLAHLRESIEKLGGFTHEIQIDIVDGVFVADRSWPYVTSGSKDETATSIALLKESVPPGMAYELDLMTHDPLVALPHWLLQAPKSIVLHIESFTDDEDIAHAIEVVKSGGAKVVLSALNDTPLARMLAFASEIDGIQCMGIAEIGRQGNHFDTRVCGRIRAIRNAYSELQISVDGSVNKETIMMLKAVGANRFVAGSAIFGAADPTRAYAELRYLLDRNV